MTLAEFRDHLASDIGLKSRGNALTADDATYLETIIQNSHAELEQLGVALWPVEDIEPFAVEAFKIYCKATISRFGFDFDPVIRKGAELWLRSLTADGQVGVGKACYF